MRKDVEAKSRGLFQVFWKGVEENKKDFSYNTLLYGRGTNPSHSCFTGRVRYCWMRVTLLC